MTKGWCPVHDRIVESRNGECPECGTPLVDLTAHPRETGEARVVVEEEDADPEPVAEAPEVAVAAEAKLWPEIRLPDRFFGRDRISIGPAAITGILVAAVLGSFLVGFAIPRGRGGDDASPPAAHTERNVGLVREGPGVDLRLESFSQDGFRVTIRVAVEEAGDAEIGRIQSIDVTPFVPGGVDEGSASMNLEVRQTVTPDSRPGFIAEGNLAIAENTRITGIRIDTLHLSAKAGADFPLDLSRLAPTSSGAPRVKLVRSAQRAVGYKGYRVSDVVSWPDRIEVRLNVSGDRDAWLADETFSLIQPAMVPADGIVVTQSPADDVTHIVFPTPPPWSERSVLRVSVRGVAISGNWAWDLP